MSKKRDRATKDAPSEITLESGPFPTEAPLFHLASDDRATDLSPGSPDTKRLKVMPGSDGGDCEGQQVDLPAAAAGRTSSDGRHPAALPPTASLRHCNGFDVVRKASRGRGRQLMVMPGLLGLGRGAASSGGKIGTLRDALSAAPVLYVEFPEGRLKCTGRTVHTKGRFFTLYADKAAGRATRMDCREMFDSVVFFSNSCWVGNAEDNPTEEPLPLPDSLQELPKNEGDVPPTFKTHFGGGNPGLSPPGNESSKPNSEAAGASPDANVAPDEGAAEATDGGEATASATPARRSRRSTKSTATYVEDTDDSEDGEGEDSGESSSSSSSNESGGARRAPKALSANAVEVGAEDAGQEEGSKAEPAGAEIFSILDAPTAKRQPPTVGSGREGTSREAGPKGSARGAKGKGRSAVATNPGSSSDEEKGESTGDDGALGGEGVASEPSRRSRRSSAMSRVRYTQSGSSEDDGGEEDGDHDEDDNHSDH